MSSVLAGGCSSGGGAAAAGFTAVGAPTFRVLRVTFESIRINTDHDPTGRGSGEWRLFRVCRDEAAEEETYVTEEDIAQVVSMWTGIPVYRIAGEESERLLKMEEALHERIIGQEEAITTLSKAVRRARAGRV